MGERRTAAGVIIVRFFDEAPRYLLLRAYRYWDFPKGEVEAGVTLLETAKREASEETGLTDLSFRWGTDHYRTEKYARNKMACYFVVESRRGEPDLPVSPELGRPEHHEWRWVDVVEGRRLLVPRVRAALDWAHRMVTEGGRR